jgi:poly-gamma-glutamate synthesis protein (capsule biosynthesis protein)
MHGEVARLKLQGVLPIVTWQYWEFYFYEATPQQQLDFRGMVDAGAAIVSGSQAHHPQAIEFYKDGFIHYGLGNLFFDQMRTLGTRQEIIDRHTIYKGRHISTELLTYMLEDYCQPRPMTPEERTELLKAVFKASGW